MIFFYKLPQNISIWFNLSRSARSARGCRTVRSSEIHCQNWLNPMFLRTIRPNRHVGLSLSMVLLQPETHVSGTRSESIPSVWQQTSETFFNTDSTSITSKENQLPICIIKIAAFDFEVSNSRTTKSFKLLMMWNPCIHMGFIST